MEGMVKDLLKEFKDIKEQQHRLEERSASDHPVKSGKKDQPKHPQALNFRKEVSELSDKINGLEGKIKSLLKRLEDCERGQDDLEQYSRRNCVVLHGCTSVPETEYHKFETFVVDTLNKHLDLKDHPVTSFDIDVTHRLKTKAPSKNAPIIIKFVRRSTKNLVYGRKKTLAGSGLSITESLTRRRLQLLHAAKDAFGQKQVTTMNGTIFAYIDKRRVTITSLTDIKNFAQSSYADRAKFHSKIRK